MTVKNILNKLKLLNSQPNVTINSGITFAAQIVLFLFGMISGILTSRLLGPQFRGVYSLLILSYSISVLLLGAGIPQFIACFAGRDTYTTSQLMQNALMVTVFGGVLALFLGGIVLVWPAILPGSWKSWYVLLIAGIVPIGILSANTQGMLQGTNQILLFNILRMAAPLVMVSLLLITLVGLKLGLSGAMAAWAAGEVAAAVGGIAATRRYFKMPFHADMPLLRHSFQFGGKILLSLIVGTFNQRFDYFLVGLICGSAGVGHYSVAVSLSMMLWYVPAAIGTVLVPELASSSEARRISLTAQGIRISLAFGAFSMIAFALAVTPLIPIVYGEAYRPTVPLFLLLLPGVAFFGLVHVTSSYFTSGLHRPAINMALAGLSFILDLLLNLVITPRIGVKGASISCAISYGISAMVALLVFSRLSKESLSDVLVPVRSDWMWLKKINRYLINGL
jgi:O-antigen/teichoic acid export membrane protein